MSSFHDGAWLIALAPPLFVVGFERVHRAYQRIGQRLGVGRIPPPPHGTASVVVVPVHSVSTLAHEALSAAAPEIATDGPSIASDIYTVGRTLAVLTIDFSGFSSGRRFELSGPDEEPLFARYDSYYRPLRRATHPDPYWRFDSAEEMAVQLTGVLREILAATDATPRPATSTLFGAEVAVIGNDVDGSGPGDLTGAAFVAALPVPHVDGADPAAGFFASVVAADPGSLVAALTAAPVRPAGVGLRLARAKIMVGDLAGAATELDVAEQVMPDDWRLFWYRALVALAAGDTETAGAGFETVYDLLPGEAAPKLAIAACAELAGRHALAAVHYQTVWGTDHSYVGAAFGLSRARLTAGDRDGAVAVLNEVPETSSYFLAAQVAAVRARVHGRLPAQLAEADLLDAGNRLTQLQLDVRRREELAVQVLEAGLGWIAAGRPAPSSRTGGRLLDADLDERALRFGLARSYRALAHQPPTRNNGWPWSRRPTPSVLGRLCSSLSLDI